MRSELTQALASGEVIMIPVLRLRKFGTESLRCPRSGHGPPFFSFQVTPAATDCHRSFTRGVSVSMSSAGDLDPEIPPPPTRTPSGANLIIVTLIMHKADIYLKCHYSSNINRNRQTTSFIKTKDITKSVTFVIISKTRNFSKTMGWQIAFMLILSKQR